jgi:hypothetical protein
MKEAQMHNEEAEIVKMIEKAKSRPVMFRYHQGSSQW